MKSMYFLGKEETHQCTAKREGDWVTFKCPHCHDYVRRMNILTGEMSSSKSDSPYRHSGLHIPIGIQPEIYSPN